MFTVEELANLLKWHKTAIKASLRNMGVNTDEPISEQDAERLALKMKKPWPPSKD